MTETLLDHLKAPGKVRLFEPGTHSQTLLRSLNYEILSDTYSMLERIVHEDADSITLTPISIAWSKDGTELDSVPTISRFGNLSEIFLHMLDRDALLRKYLRLIARTDEVFVFEIVHETQDES